MPDPMMKLEPNDLIAKVDNALETMCFVMADAIDPDEIDDAPSLRAWIQFHNESESGCVELAATLGFVQEVGSGLLGIDMDEISEDQHAQDVLLELANVVAGEVVNLLGGENTLFELGIPSMAPAEVDVPTEHIAVSFDSMGEVFCVDVERGLPASSADAA